MDCAESRHACGPGPGLKTAPEAHLVAFDQEPPGRWAKPVVPEAPTRLSVLRRFPMPPAPAKSMTRFIAERVATSGSFNVGIGAISLYSVTTGDERAN